MSFPWALHGYHNEYHHAPEISRAMLRDFSVRGPGHTTFVAFGKFSIKLYRLRIAGIFHASSQNRFYSGIHLIQTNWKVIM